MPVTVIDSSVALKWLFPEPGSDHAFRYVRAADVISADILLVECANVLAKKVRANNMDRADAIGALAMIESAVTRLVRSDALVKRALELSILLSHPVYDCVFLACAEQAGGLLATADQPLIKRAAERGFGHLLEPAA